MQKPTNRPLGKLCCLTIKLRLSAYVSTVERRRKKRWRTMARCGSSWNSQLCFTHDKPPQCVTWVRAGEWQQTGTWLTHTDGEGNGTGPFMHLEHCFVWMPRKLPREAARHAAIEADHSYIASLKSKLIRNQESQQSGMQWERCKQHPRHSK